jgi:hypothetical protein
MKLACVVGFLALGLVSLGAGTSGPTEGTAQVPAAFVTADRCTSCHNALKTPDGVDVSVGTAWRGSMMANAARDPYWQASVRSECTEHPTASAAIENKCALCHMPMASVEMRAAGRPADVFEHLAKDRQGSPLGRLAMDGVSCTACHQIADKGLGQSSSFSGGFVTDTKAEPGQRTILGSFEVDKNRNDLMKLSSGFGCAKSTHLASAEYCATCHTLYTRGPDAASELPEQVPYLEWKHSSHSPAATCQSCHMPRVKDTPIASRNGQNRPFLGQHMFQSGNFLVPAMLDSRRDELAVTARSAELAATAEKSVEYLKKSAARLGIAGVEVSGDKLTAEVAVTNLAGHKLPTGYPSRRVWIHFVVKGANGTTVFESGALQADGAIRGNDNDSDATRYEPHYREIDSQDQVQIYESIMASAEGKVTTGLLTAVRYVKDNRLLPTGFDKAQAGPDIAVRGPALEDGDFGPGEDRVRYQVQIKPEAGPFTVEAELMYQPIGYRWAHNLKPRSTAETDRFVSLFESKAGNSAVVVARATTTPKP